MGARKRVSLYFKIHLAHVSLSMCDLCISLCGCCVNVLFVCVCVPCARVSLVRKRTHLHMALPMSAGGIAVTVLAGYGLARAPPAPASCPPTEVLRAECPALGFHRPGPGFGRGVRWQLWTHVCAISKSFGAMRAAVQKVVDLSLVGNHPLGTAQPRTPVSSIPMVCFFGRSVNNNSVDSRAGPDNLIPFIVRASLSSFE